MSLPAISLQFVPSDATSRYDCTAASGAMLARIDSRGQFNFTHHDVRWHTNEPVPDFLSPGLNWNQVDASLFLLTGGKVNLDVRPAGSAFASLPAALRAGKWAGLSIMRSVLVDAGLGYTSPFRGGHAVVLGYDQDRKLPILLDPLVSHPIDLSWVLMQRACEVFTASFGESGYYGALTRDVYDAPTLRYSAIFAPGRFFIYRVTNGAIAGRDTHPAFSGATSAPAGPPERFPWSHGARKLHLITKGSLKGLYVEPGTSNVRVKVAA